MSRNLARTDCYFCGGHVVDVEEPREITAEDCGAYLETYAGMTVANAECRVCGAKYLAWVTTLFSWHGRDLSFRSTFNDEPGDADMPTREGGPILRHLWDALALAEAPHEDHTGITDCSVARSRSDCCSFCAAADAIRLALRELGVHAFWTHPGRTVVVDEATHDRIVRAGVDFLPSSELQWQRLEEMAAKRPPPTLTKFDETLKEYFRPEDIGAMARKP